ncbi:MAG: hypothetical protein HY820_41290 [Acidobacteria bacterium]|nr:hypothetical protein [Acidobacteriota bacterium]
MRRLAHWLVRLYPRAWRERYGEEFHALLDDCPPDKLKIASIVTAALSMRLGAMARSPLGWGSAGAVTGASLLLMWAAITPARYVSHATILAQGSDRRQIMREVGAASQSALRRSELIGIMDRHGLFREERARMPAEDVVEKMRQSIRVSFGQPALVLVDFVYPDPMIAQRVTQDLQVALMSAAGGLTLLDPASLPTTPAWPNLLAVAGTGLIAGALLGAAGFLLRRKLAPAASNPKN